MCRISCDVGLSSAVGFRISSAVGLRISCDVGLRISLGALKYVRVFAGERLCVAFVLLLECLMGTNLSITHTQKHTHTNGNILVQIINANIKQIIQNQRKQ